MPALIKVRVQPRASRNEVIGFVEGALRVRLTAPPVDGAANKALVEIVAAVLGVKRGAVRLVAGEKSRDKVVAVDGLNDEEALARLKR